MWKLLQIAYKVAQAARHLQGHVLAPFERLLERLGENDYAGGREEIKTWADYQALEGRVAEILGRYGVPATAVPAVMDEILPASLEWIDGWLPEEQIEPIVEALRQL